MTQLTDERLPFTAHAESTIGQGAETTWVGGRRNQFMNVVLQRMDESTVSVIDEDQRSVRTVGLMHLGELG